MSSTLNTIVKKDEHNTKPIVIVVDGIIGSGKTSCIRECLKPQLRLRGYKVTAIYEPVELWKKSGVLERYYQDPTRFAYQFQTRIFHDRIKVCQAKYKKYLDNIKVDTQHIFLAERSIFTDIIFMKMLHDTHVIHDHEYTDYIDLWTMWSQLLPFDIDAFIYIDPSIDEAMRRVKLRSRKGESTISKEYQTDLHTLHDIMFGTVRTNSDTSYNTDTFFDNVAKNIVQKKPIYTIQTDANFIDDEETKERIVSGLIAYLGV